MITLNATDTLQFTENRRLGIINYGADNLYPNNSKVMADNSGTLKKCLQIKEKFLFGKGVTENDGFWKMKVNPFGLRTDKLVRLMCRSLATFNGFALQIGYNALLEKVSVQLLNFENLRLPQPDDNGNVNEVWYHPDWSSRRIEEKDIVKYNLYTTDKEVIARQIEAAGGFDKWRGHVMYFGADGRVQYPHNSFHGVLEDVITDIKLKKGKNANVSTNFLASHFIEFPFMFRDVSPYPEDKKEGSTTDRFKSEVLSGFEKFMGVENTGKMGVLENPSKDKDGNSIPYKIHKIDVQNFDKLYEFTENSVKNAIRGIFNQPQILHDAVSTGFSTEIMNDMYKFYNAVTYEDRLIIEEALMEVFAGWQTDINPIDNYSIIPLTFE